MKTFANYINKTLKFLWLYMKKIRKYEMDYYRAKEKLTSDSVLEVMDAPSAIAHERKIIQTYSTAAIFYNKLKDIAIKYKNGINVEQELRIFNEELNDAHLPIFEKTFIRLKTMKKNPADNILSGTMTGGAAMATNPHKANFSDQAQFDFNMRTNMLLNRNNPDAQELANIFLGDPYKAPYSEEYKHLTAGFGKVLNSKYNLTKTNKEIKNYSDGFAYSRYSTLAKNVSNYADLRNQIKKHYNEETNSFDINKIDVNFDLDQNLHCALGHATILEPSIKNGYFQGILFDIYDFDIGYYDYYNSAFITVANNYFWHLQEKYPYKIFYILAPVSFKW